MIFHLVAKTVLLLSKVFKACKQSGTTSNFLANDDSELWTSKSDYIIVNILSNHAFEVCNQSYTTDNMLVNNSSELVIVLNSLVKCQSQMMALNKIDKIMQLTASL